MSVRVNHNKFLADFMIDGKRIKRQFDTELDAKAFEIETRRQHQYGKPIEAIEREKVFTLRQMLDKTFVKYWQNKPNEEISSVNMRIIEGFFTHSTPMASITTEKVDDFIMHLQAKGNAPSTINSKLSTLSKCVRFAHDRGYIKAKPKIDRPKVGNNARLRFLSEAEETTIAEVIQTSDFNDFFIWSVDTGMRPSEARNLHTRNIRKDDALGWVVDIKIVKDVAGTTLPRTLPLTHRAVAAYNRLSADCENCHPFSIFTKQEIRKQWDAVRGILQNKEKDFVFYLARHTCASRMVQRGVDITIVQKWMGHKNIQTTMIYAKLVPENLLIARDALTNPPNYENINHTNETSYQGTNEPTIHN
jgi:integrase